MHSRVQGVVVDLGLGERARPVLRRLRRRGGEQRRQRQGRERPPVRRERHPRPGPLEAARLPRRALRDPGGRRSHHPPGADARRHRALRRVELSPGRRPERVGHRGGPGPARRSASSPTIPSAWSTAVRPDALSTSLFLPDLSVGRLVETPEEITTAIATFIGQDGVLDLGALDPASGHKVLVTGYDFLQDSAVRIRDRWKAVFGVTGSPDSALAPVDGSLVGGNWGISTVADRRAALLARFCGNGGSRYGIASLSGHASHSLEGVPADSGSFTDIEGLAAAGLLDANACGTGRGVDLAGRRRLRGGLPRRSARARQQPGRRQPLARPSPDLAVARGRRLCREQRLRLGPEVRARLQQAPHGAAHRASGRARHRRHRGRGARGQASLLRPDGQPRPLRREEPHAVDVLRPAHVRGEDGNRGARRVVPRARAEYRWPRRRPPRPAWSRWGA